LAFLTAASVSLWVGIGGISRAARLLYPKSISRHPTPRHSQFQADVMSSYFRGLRPQNQCIRSFSGTFLERVRGIEWRLQWPENIRKLSDSTSEIPPTIPPNDTQGRSSQLTNLVLARGDPGLIVNFRRSFYSLLPSNAQRQPDQVRSRIVARNFPRFLMILRAAPSRSQMCRLCKSLCAPLEGRKTECRAAMPCARRRPRSEA
jgi:hypothetical protein